MLSGFTLFIQPLDVDLTTSSQGINHLYPAPLTGHDLMALFPPAPPSMLEKKPAYTNGLFRREERTFFSRDAIVRARMEIDLPWESDGNHRPKTGNREPLVNQNNGRCQYSQMVVPSPAPTGPHSRHHSSVISILPSSSERSSNKAQCSYQHEHTTLVDAAPPNTEITQDNSDEAWRRPMPYAERRRAGKHTKRVIVRT